MEQKYIVAIEIGSSKIKGAIGSIDETGTLTVLAVEEEKVLDSVRYGCIQNVDMVCNAVSQVVSRLEQDPGIAPRKIKSVYVSVGGRSLSSVIVNESTTLPDETEITEYIIEQIKYKVKTTAIADRDVIDVVPCKYFVDKQMVPNPVGVFGQTLTAKMNLIVCKPQIKRNINRVLCERLPFAIAGYIVRPVAIADIVLTDNEKRLGCMFVDFGAETTTVSIYKDAVLQYIATLPMGSRNITRNITATNCIEEKAEEFKIAHGSAIADGSAKKTTADGVDVAEINSFVQARSSEIVANIIEQLNYAGYKAAELPQGIIIVGGGAKLRGFNSLLGTNSDMKVRSGAPAGMIRIVDSSIQAYDSIDVLALLMAASRMSALECTYMPEVEIEDEPVEIQEEIDADDIDDFVEEEPQPVKTQKKNRWGVNLNLSALKEKVVRIVTESADDESDGYDDEE